MAIGGFAHILSESGASNELVYYSVKPIEKIKNPYILIGLFYIVGAFLSLFITSAVGLGLLCMVTIYPILRGVGVSPVVRSWYDYHHRMYGCRSPVHQHSAGIRSGRN